MFDPRQSEWVSGCLLSPKGFKNSLRVFKKDRRVSKEIQIVPLRGLSGALRGSRGCSGSFRSSQRTQRVSKGPSRFFISSLVLRGFLKALRRLKRVYRGPLGLSGGFQGPLRALKGFQRALVRPNGFSGALRGLSEYLIDSQGLSVASGALRGITGSLRDS